MRKSTTPQVADQAAMGAKGNHNGHSQNPAADIFGKAPLPRRHLTLPSMVKARKAAEAVRDRAVSDHQKASRKPLSYHWLNSAVYRRLYDCAYAPGTKCTIWYEGVAGLPKLNAKDAHLLSFVWWVYMASSYQFLGVNETGEQYVRITASQLARELHVQRQWVWRPDPVIENPKGHKHARTVVRKWKPSGLQKLVALGYVEAFQDCGYLCIRPLTPADLGRRIRVPDAVLAICGWSIGPALAATQIFYWLDARREMGADEQRAEREQREMFEHEGMEPPEPRVHRVAKLRSPTVIDGRRVAYLSRHQLARQLGRGSPHDEEVRNWLDAVAGIARKRKGAEKDQQWAKPSNRTAKLFDRLYKGDKAYYAPSPELISARLTQVIEDFSKHVKHRQRVKRLTLPPSTMPHHWPGMAKCFAKRKLFAQQRGETFRAKVIRISRAEAEIARRMPQQPRAMEGADEAQQRPKRRLTCARQAMGIKD
jgi:hypothetical protein